MANGLADVAYLRIQQLQSKISIHFRLCFWTPDEHKSNIYFLALFCSPPSTEGISDYWVAKCPPASC